MTIRLPAEWEEQDGILLAWPHEESDWMPYLDVVEPVYFELVRRICEFERVLILAPDRKSLLGRLKDAGVCLEKVTVLEIPVNDTWTRDFGPITILENDRPVLLDFGFHGWGLKFPADRDNQVNRQLHHAGAFDANPLRTPGLILEGGSIESDGRGTLLTTAECLLNPNRNPHMNRKEIEEQLSLRLGADHFLWLENGYLAGDDTDSHIDTLVRLAPEDTLLYVTCEDGEDEHFEALKTMREELEAFRTREGKPFRLIPLPWPSARHDEEGQRLPATFANFLVINGAVLAPVYGDPRDEEALEAIGEAFPDRDIIGVDCSALILQHGSLHCVTMQLPKGVLK